LEVAELTVEGARLAQEQLDLTRRFSAGELAVSDYVAPFMSARNDGIHAGGCDDFVLLDFLDDVWYAIDMLNDDDLRQPDEFDDAQLLEVLTGYLADWDAGTWQFDPRWARE
jgi:hypothetical protein